MTTCISGNCFFFYLQKSTPTKRSAPSWRTRCQESAAPGTSCSTIAKLWVASTLKFSAWNPPTTTPTHCGRWAVTWWLSTSRLQVGSTFRGPRSTSSHCGNNAEPEWWVYSRKYLSHLQKHADLLHEQLSVDWPSTVWLKGTQTKSNAAKVFIYGVVQVRSV